MQFFEDLLPPDRTPIFMTVGYGQSHYNDGKVHDKTVDAVEIAKRRQWRILDRGGIVHALEKRIVSDWPVAERAAIGELFYNDGVHFTGAVYQEFNRLLLSMIVNKEGGKLEGVSFSPLPSPSPSTDPEAPLR